METVSLKFDESFLKVIENVMRKNNYSTKTEFIREAIRDKISAIEKEAALLRLEKMYGASTRKTTDEDLRKARARASAYMIKKFK